MSLHKTSDCRHSGERVDSQPLHSSLTSFCINTSSDRESTPLPVGAVIVSPSGRGVLTCSCVLFSASSGLGVGVTLPASLSPTEVSLLASVASASVCSALGLVNLRLY